MDSQQKHSSKIQHIPKRSFAAVAAMNAPKQDLVPNQHLIDSGSGKFVRPAVPLQVSTQNRRTSKTEVDEHEPGFPNEAVGNGSIKHSDPSEVAHRGSPIGIHTPLSDALDSRVSTKPPSPDRKSVASGMTFAMEEKESLRPDDSASVNVTEEDESASGQVSNTQDSAVASETSGEAFGDQIKEVTKQLSALPVNGNAGIHVSMSGMPLHQPSTMSSQHSLGPSGTDQSPVLENPDEKLLDALENHQDRAWILSLETTVVDFVQGKRPNESQIEVRNGNSFYRMLAHRLADYYGLDHHVDPWRSDTIRLTRTKQTRLPKLLDLHRPVPPPIDAQIAATPSMKIIRRANNVETSERNGSGVSTTANSAGPSKATSEIGDESLLASGLVSPTESNATGSKAAISREEREAKYQETRNRIFKDFKPNDSTEPSQNNSNEASRANSAVGGRNKGRKAKHNVNDEFHGRSAYNTLYPGHQYAMIPPAYGQAGIPLEYLQTLYQEPGPHSTQHIPAPPTQAVMPPFPQQPQQPTYPMYPYPNGLSQATQQSGQHLPYGQMLNPNAVASTIPGQHAHIMGGQSFVNQHIPLPSLAMSNSSAPVSRPTSQMSDHSLGQFGFATPGQYQPVQPQQVFQHTAQALQFAQHYIHQDPQMAQYMSQAPPFNAQVPQHPNQAGFQAPQMPHYALQMQQFGMQTYQYVPQMPQGADLGMTANTQIQYPAQYAHPQHQQNTPRQMQSMLAAYQGQPVHMQQAQNQTWSQVPGSTQAMPGLSPAHMQGQRHNGQQHSGFHTLPATPQIARKSSGQAPSSIAKFPTPASLPQKPPPAAQSGGGSSLPATGGQGVPSFQNGMFRQPQ